MCACVCVCEYMCVYVFAHACEEQRTTLGVIAQEPFALLFETRSLPGWELSSKRHCLSSEHMGLPVSCSWSAGMINT